MKKSAKKKTIASKVVGKLALSIFIINAILTVNILQTLDSSLTEAEEKYMAEVITRVSGEVNSELSLLVDIVQGMSKNYILNDFLSTIEENPNVTMDNLKDQPGYDFLIRELDVIAQLFKDSVLYVSLCTVELDNFVTHLGQQGDSSYSLATRPYFNAVSTGSTYISEPYQDVLSDFMAVAIAEPIFSEDGRITGIFTIEFSTEQLSHLVTSTSFGETGNTYILDQTNAILIHDDPTFVGQDITHLDYEGEEIQRELTNPTGEIVTYRSRDVNRIGGVSNINELSGWKVVAGMNTSEFKSAIQAVWKMLVATQVVTLLISTVFCTFGICKNLAPMKKLEVFMEELAKGKLDSTIDYHEPDEIGRLAQSMQDTASTLSLYIAQIDATMKEFGQGNFELNTHYQYQGDFKSIENSMEEFVLLISHSIFDLKRALSEVNQGANQVSGGAQLLASGSTEQAQSVVGLNSLIGNINTTIVDTAKNSSSVTENARAISHDLVESNQKMHELVISVQDIKAMSDEVKRIIKTIEEVAFQTNILSLNASVEAARAGQSGRGFAVVADEVRNLSIRTAEAAEETTKIINDIANAINTGTNLAQNTSKDLQQVVDDVDRFVQKISNISLSAQDQAEAIANINDGIAQISTVVSKNSAISEESAAASEELSSQSDLMMTLVEKFKLN